MCFKTSKHALYIWMPGSASLRTFPLLISTQSMLSSTPEDAKSWAGRLAGGLGQPVGRSAGGRGRHISWAGLPARSWAGRAKWLGLTAGCLASVSKKWCIISDIKTVL